MSSFTRHSFFPTPIRFVSYNEKNLRLLKQEITRKKTFRNWASSAVNPSQLAKAGFFYFNDGDKVQCIFCLGIIGNWEKNDDVMMKHKTLFPNCPFISGLSVDNIPLISKYMGVILKPGYSINDLNIQTYSHPIMPMFITLDSRLKSYENWPISLSQKPQDLSKAGFYYTGLGDEVKCYHCNGTINMWEKGKDPLKEHIKRFPDCHYINLLKGSEYIKDKNKMLTDSNACQIKIKELINQEPVSEENDKINLLCKICFKKELKIITLPCGHLSSCEECISSIFNCIICNKIIAGYICVYMN